MDKASVGEITLKTIFLGVEAIVELSCNAVQLYIRQPWLDYGTKWNGRNDDLVGMVVRRGGRPDNLV